MIGKWKGWLHYWENLRGSVALQQIQTQLFGSMRKMADTLSRVLTKEKLLILVGGSSINGIISGKVGLLPR